MNKPLIPALPDMDQAGIGVLIKTFTIIEFLATKDTPLPLRDVAAGTLMPKGTLYRILQTLLNIGYVAQRDADGFYHLTGKFQMLAGNAGHEAIRNLLAPKVQALHAQFNETVNVGVLDGAHVIYVTVLESTRALSWAVPAGFRDRFETTSLGRAIAAFLPRAAQDSLLDMVDKNANARITRAQLTNILEHTAQNGFALEREETDAGVICIGAPVFVNNKVAAAVSLSIPTSRYSDALERQVRDELHAADLRFTL